MSRLSFPGGKNSKKSQERCFGARWGFACCHLCMKNSYCVPIKKGQLEALDRLCLEFGGRKAVRWSKNAFRFLRVWVVMFFSCIFQHWCCYCCWLRTVGRFCCEELVMLSLFASKRLRHWLFVMPSMCCCSTVGSQLDCSSYFATAGFERPSWIQTAGWCWAGWRRTGIAAGVLGGNSDGPRLDYWQINYIRFYRANKNGHWVPPQTLKELHGKIHKPLIISNMLFWSPKEPPNTRHPTRCPCASQDPAPSPCPLRLSLRPKKSPMKRRPRSRRRGSAITWGEHGGVWWFSVEDLVFL